MNAIFFASKRAFQGVLRVTRRPLGSLGLTAARFDLMFALLRGDTAGVGGATRQSDLRRTLGVSASVVSRMLRSLEALGWVQRTRALHDRRQRQVSLTESGRWRIRTAYKTLFRAAQRLVDWAICFGKHRNRNARYRHMATLEAYLDAMRRHYGDIASLYYPWGHPDD
ncbi:MAG TPA: MarR family transcriptional regulator [Polyangiaceae bacterium]|jgi:DNA-binding MarR family transcriptional regulator|nr:MarR family transcriptional regulator [Polyangiaceae bacterium]